jgi:hypothetical protein
MTIALLASNMQARLIDVITTRDSLSGTTFAATPMTIDAKVSCIPSTRLLMSLSAIAVAWMYRPTISEADSRFKIWVLPASEGHFMLPPLPDYSKCKFDEE